MPIIDKHAPGSFCWIELATSDQPAAKAFYSSLFGWTVNDFPMGPGDVYTIFRLDGRDSGAAYTMRADQREQGVPPNWLLYIAVESADDAAALISASGGKVCAPPFDVMDAGRMSVVQDPTGAVFAVWQAKKNSGLGVAGDAGAFCWADLNTPNRDAARQFYEAVFGWKVVPGEGKDDSGYLHIQNGAAMIGGMPPAEAVSPNAPPHWMIYFAVADVAATVEKAKVSGAQIFMGPVSMAGVGDLAVLADPQGATFALFKGEA
jgi:predicted enzyme related to lactoylglutathione lyase